MHKKVPVAKKVLSGGGRKKLYFGRAKNTMSKKNFLWGKICWIHEIAASGKMLRSVPPVIVIRLPVGTERRRQQSKLERRSKTNVEENESKYREGISWGHIFLWFFQSCLRHALFLLRALSKSIRDWMKRIFSKDYDKRLWLVTTISD